MYLSTDYGYILDNGRRVDDYSASMATSSGALPLSATWEGPATAPELALVGASGKTT